MGANISNQYTQNTVDSLSSVINDTTNTVLQNVSTFCASTNTYSAKFGIYPVSFSNGQVTATAPCPTNISSVNITQIASNTCSITGGITNDIQENLTATLANNINTWMTQNQDQNNGWIAIGLNIAASESITQEELSNMIANTISSNVSQTCSAFLDASNVADLYYCGNYPNGIINTQKAVSSNLSSCMINNLVTAITNDSVLNDIVTKVDQKTSQTNEGLSTIAKWIIIAVIVVAALILIGGLLYLIFSSKSGGQTPQDKTTQEKMALERRLMEERRIREGRENALRRGETSERAAERAAETRTLPPLEKGTTQPREGLFDKFERLGNEYAARYRAYRGYDQV